MTMEFSSFELFLRERRQACLLLARHGETDWNAEGLIQGQQDRPLSPEGFRQRKTLFFRLRDVPLARIYTSALQRTIQTALPLSEEKKIPLEIVPALNEAKLGVFEGEHKVNFSDELSRRTYTDFLNDEVNVILPGGGESLRCVDERIREPLRRIRTAVEREGHVLVVAHRNVNKMLIRNLLNLTLEEGYRVESKNNWLYVFAPREREIFLVELHSPTGKVKVKPGYRQIEGGVVSRKTFHSRTAKLK